MWNGLKNVVLCLAALQILAQSVTVECKRANPKSKGKSKAFGAGIAAGGLTGVLGGAAIGHFLTKNNSPQEIHHHHYIGNNPISSVPNTAVSNPVPTAPQRTTIIEKGEVLPNGCYKQTVKEPDQHDSSKYIETEQLICPQNLPTVSPATFTHLAPVVTIQQVQPVVPVTHMITVPIHIQPVQLPQETAANPKTNNIPLQPNPPTAVLPSNIVPALPVTPVTSNTAPVLVQAPQQEHTAASAPLQPNSTTPNLATNVAPVLPVMPIANNPLPQPALVQPIQPAFIPARTVAAPPQVIVLSKTTGFYGDDQKKKKKNAATSLVANSFSFLLCMMLITGFFLKYMSF